MGISKDEKLLKQLHFWAIAINRSAVHNVVANEAQNQLHNLA
jgi:hypothetical protein